MAGKATEACTARELPIERKLAQVGINLVRRSFSFSCVTVWHRKSCTLAATSGSRQAMINATHSLDRFGQAGKAIGDQCGDWGRFVRMDIEGIQTPNPFQAEYEGSIPSTRSKQFQ